VLEEKQIPYKYIEGILHLMSYIYLSLAQYFIVNPYHKPESLLKLNSRGLVPTLEFDNKPLYESTVIYEFLDDAYPDNKPQLLPKDSYDRARTRIWTDFMMSRIIPSVHRFLQFQPMDDKKGQQEVRKEFISNLKQFTEQMAPEGPHFMGEEPCRVDFIVTLFVVRLWVFHHFKEGLVVPEEAQGCQDEHTWTWRKWLDAIESRKSIKETISDRERYLSIYQRYADNTAQSELTKANRKERVVP